MKHLVRRCWTAVAVALALEAFALALLARLAGAALTTLSVAVLFALPVLSGLFAHARLSALRRDLATVIELVSTAACGKAPARAHRAETAEASALIERVALVGARSVELERIEADARRAIEEAERVRVSFVAAMGHDLRGPLNSIIGFADLLVMDGHDAVAAAQRPSVELIRRGAHDLLLLLEQILIWAKLEAGQITLEREAVRLNELLEDAVREAQTRSADRGLSFELDFEPGLPFVEVDRARLLQALLGLMDHAVRAPDPMQVRLSARVLAAGDEQPRRVRIDLCDPELRVRAADLDSFFEAFRPSYAPSGRRVTGLGLGPALARALIRAHGGQVWFASRADTGTTFSAELPLGS